MRIGFRADAGLLQGVGHVMRCLTLAQKLTESDVEVVFFTSVPKNSWINNELTRSRIQIINVEKNSFDRILYDSYKLNLLIVDSYEIESKKINGYSRQSPLMAIIDGDTRGIDANIYLDQNLGSSVNNIKEKKVDALYLFGSEYALIRDEILNIKKTDLKTPKSLDSSSLLCFSGGTDPNSTIISMAEIVSKIKLFQTVFISSKDNRKELDKILKNSNHKIIEFNPNISDLISQTDSVFCSTGTTAWEILTVGIPSIFTISAENQWQSAQEIESHKVGVIIGDSNALLTNVEEKRGLIQNLLLDVDLRNEIFENCNKFFDGKGSIRVVTEILSCLSE